MMMPLHACAKHVLACHRETPHSTSFCCDHCDGRSRDCSAHGTASERFGDGYNAEEGPHIWHCESTTIPRRHSALRGQVSHTRLRVGLRACSLGRWAEGVTVGTRRHAAGRSKCQAWRGARRRPGDDSRGCRMSVLLPLALLLPPADATPHPSCQFWETLDTRFV